MAVDTVTKKAPAAIRPAFIRNAPRLPRLSVKGLPARLPTSPPIVKAEVTTENWVSFIGIQVGRPW